MKRIIYFIFIISGTFLNSISGQYRGNENFYRENEFQEAYELYINGKYQLAQTSFSQIMEEEKNYSVNEIENACYYHALCAIELLNPDAEFFTTNFIEKYPSSGRRDQLEFETGRFFYRKKEFEKALYWFEKVDVKNIKQQDRDEFYFSRGYCNFEFDSIDKARINFYEIKDKEGIYASSSLYYYSHINYSQGNYQTALEGFDALRNDSTFSSIVPYYISQIYFLQNRYEDVIDFASDFLDHVTEKRKAEVARIIAESYFKLKQYKEAIPYYNIYTENSNVFTEDDYYQAGYSYYKAGEFGKAAEQFERISDNQSLLGQNASYHLADCYIKTNEKQKALIAFTNASKTNFDMRIKEDASFNKAILHYELSVSPFSASIRDFESYIETFPNSARIDEAYNYLVLAYINTKNYAYALSSMEKIKNPTEDVNKAYQHIAFFRAIELVENGQYESAVNTFNLSLQNGKYNKTLKVLSVYWKAECYYRLGRYHEATKNYQEFILSPGSYLLTEYKMAHYNLGYAYFKQKKYSEALSWFRKYTRSEQVTDPDILCDAYCRSGDIAYLQNNYQEAISFYGEAAKIQTNQSDYALFQQGFAYGLLGNYNQKINTLEKLVNQYPSSNYYDDALFETGVSYQIINDLDKAYVYYSTLLNDHPGSKYEKSALVQLGLLYYNQNQPDKAIKTYQKVIADYPGSDEANSALKGLKNIYLEKNEVESYLNYVDKMGGQAKLSRTEVDSLLFTNAENIYFSGDCDKAVAKLNNYISQFPNSAFTKRAGVYLADCYQQQNKEDEAIKSYAQVLNMPGSEFREQALIEASRINYTQGNYEEAYKLYRDLEKEAKGDNNLMEAQIGLMRCAFQMKNYKETAEAATKVVEKENQEKEFIKEANFYLAKSNFELKKYDQAIKYFGFLAENLRLEEGAEAKYRIAEIYVIQGNLKKAEEVIYDFIKLNTPHQYWMVKSYLLLAEIFYRNKDYFQAKHTVQSILDNYEKKDDDILSSANDLKDKITEMEKLQNKKESDDLEIFIDEN